MLVDPIEQFAHWYLDIKTLYPSFEAEALCFTTINHEGYREGR